MTKTEKATRRMEEMANNDRYGYSWGGWGPYDYDCGHAVITAWEEAGVPVKTRGAAWTGNMREIFLSCGFKDVTASVNFNNAQGLVRGDVLLNTQMHAAMYIGSGKIVHARSSEGNEISGDQNGREFCLQAYFNYPWNCALRYIEVADEKGEEETVHEESSNTSSLSICGPQTWARLISRMPVVSNGDVGWAVTAMQAMLNYCGYELDADGDYGPLTEQALVDFNSK